MINHYNAFISYKHAPEDNKVAEAVQKGLERYRIPGKIRKKTGMKRINRIFRDKDELPITSDLSDTIANALENSDYLIVICSTNTKESAWVSREIEYFLKNHTKRDIFTVLVNGEPCDVIPEILLYEERVEIDENGKEQSVRVPIEPLSCDYRMTLGKAKKTELPRLACGLIGCSYDELMNRHRQYRLKQLTACFSLVLATMIGFCGYMYYSRNEIQKNLLESLRNQSKYLANESGIFLEKEQRITALQLALEALPKDDSDDRPVTAEAVKALTDATLAYEGNDGTNIHAAWNYQMPNIISDFTVSEDGGSIAILDTGSVVGVWNTDRHDRILYLDNLEDVVIGIQFLNDESLIVWTDQKIICYDITSGEEKWTYFIEDDFFKNKTELMLLGNSFYIGTYNRNYLQLNSESGELLSRLSIPEKEGYEDMSILESKLSPDGKKIAYSGLCSMNNYAYGIIDISSNELVLSEPVEEMVRDIEWAGNDKLMVASNYVNLSESQSLGLSDILSSDHSKVQCIDADDLTEKWNSDFICNGVLINSGFANLGNQSVAYYSGNVISVYDVETGNEHYSNNVNDSVIDVSDMDGDGIPLYITENGGYAFPTPLVDTDAVYYTRYFADELRQVVINNGMYVRQQLSSEVIYYGVHVYDEEWTPLSDQTVLADVSDQISLSESCLAVMSTDQGEPILTIFGLDDSVQTSQNRLGGEDIYSYKMLGVFRDRVYMGYDNDGCFNLVSVDVRGNEVKNDELFMMTSFFDNLCSMKEGKLIYCYMNDDQKSMLVIDDLETGKSKEWEIPEEASYFENEPVYYEEDKVVYVCGDSEYIIDAESGEAGKIKVPENWNGASCFSDVSDGGVFAVSDRKQILFVDRNGKIEYTISCPGANPRGMTFLNNTFLVLCDDGSIYWYEKDTRNLIKKTDVSSYYNFQGIVTFDYDRDSNLLYIQTGMLTDIVDVESGMEIAHVDNCFGYHKGRDILITESKGSDDDIQVGYYKRYTTKELIDKAHNILQGAELSEEMKLRYGINGDDYH